MKKSALNLLWQQKRNNLPIDENEQADWADMHQLLDAQLPVSTGTIATPSVFKTILVHIIKFKLLYTLAALSVAGTTTYFLIDHSITVQTSRHDHPEIKKENINNAAYNKSDKQNSSSNVAITDSATTKTASDYNNAVPNDTKKSIGNKTKASVPDDHTNTGTSIGATGVAKPTSGINNSENKALSLINNKKANIAKKPSPNNRIFSLSTGNARGGSPSGKLSTWNNSHGNYGHPGNNRFKFNSSVSQIADRNNTRGGVRKTRVSGPDTGRPATGLPNYIQHRPNEDVLQTMPSQLFNWDADVLLTRNLNSKIILKAIVDRANTKALKSAKIKDKTGWALPIDWGVLAGINAPGSFTANDKKNTNGVPFDIHLGLFVNYHLNDNWSVNLQVKLPSPHQASGNYLHTEQGKLDTGRTQSVNSKITDIRKMYMVDIPLHLVYHLSPNISIKAGPVLSIPLTEANGISTVTTSGTPKDSANYFVKLSEALNHTSIERKIYYGLSGGISLNYRRFLLDATYYHNLQTQKVNSSLGVYTSNNNSLQIAIGFRINKKK